MAGKGATLAIRIVSDASKAQKGFGDAERQVDRFSRGLDRASVGATAALGALGLVANEALQSASALQQSAGAVESVFGAHADAVKALSDDSAQRLGLAKSQYQEMAVLMGSQLQNLGFSAEDTVPKMDSLMTRAADLAAMFGGSTTQAVEAMSSALKGERDPIEAYGVTLTQAAVDAQVAAMGLDTSTDAAARNAQAQATLALILDQTSAAQGTFADEAGSAAGAAAIAGASFEDAKASLGEVLLPIVAQAMGMFTEFTGFLTEHKGVVLAVVAVVGTLAAATLLVNGAMTAWRTTVAIATAAQWLWNVAMSANPIGLIVIAITAIIAAVVLAYQKFQWFRDAVAAIGRFLGSVFDGFMDVIGWIVDKLSWIGDAASWVGDLLSSPMAVTVSDGRGTTAAAGGVFGAAAGMRGAPMGSLAGAGTSPSGAGQGSGNVVVNVQIRDAIDPVSTGRTLERILRDYARATGSQVALTVGRAR